jgi:hypothetical protein
MLACWTGPNTFGAHRSAPFTEPTSFAGKLDPLFMLRTVRLLGLGYGSKLTTV